LTQRAKFGLLGATIKIYSRSHIRLCGKTAVSLFVWFIVVFAHPAYAADIYWLANPVDNNWFNPANWSGRVPGSSDTAHFHASTITNIELTAANWEVFAIRFAPGADAYTITLLPGASGTIDDGIRNDSGVEQNFVCLTNGSSSSFLEFYNRYSAFPGTITGPVTFTQYPVNSGDAYPPDVWFYIKAGAGDATFHNLGASVAAGAGGRTDFVYSWVGPGKVSAEQCTIINDGGTAPGAGGGATQFILASPSAGDATLIANGGSNGGEGGSFSFYYNADGGRARVELFGNGYLDLSGFYQRPRLSIGSLEGDGIVYLGTKILSAGGNSLSTTFSGLLQPGTPGGGSGTGGLEKTGDGTFTLTGASVYTEGTTVLRGTLLVANTNGSATGTGPVSVNSGTLGGSGTIAGPVTIGSSAFLAPAGGTQTKATLTIQSSLTLSAAATYTYTFKARASQAETDKVVADGVTINSNANFNLIGQTQGALTQGLVLTVIDNTALTPIAGTFVNLPDGGIVTINGNNLQASYEGGDGNDLTLTVVP
jgi:autotransporter-associated beta strand protein